MKIGHFFYWTFQMPQKMAVTFISTPTTNRCYKQHFIYSSEFFSSTLLHPRSIIPAAAMSSSPWWRCYRSFWPCWSWASQQSSNQNQSINQPIDQPTNYQPINQPNNQPINQPTNYQLFNQSTNQSISQSIKQLINQSIRGFMKNQMDTFFAAFSKTF